MTLYEKSIENAEGLYVCRDCEQVPQECECDITLVLRRLLELGEELSRLLGKVAPSSSGYGDLDYDIYTRLECARTKLK